MIDDFFLEIHGAGFSNKGAELMLLAIVDHFKRKYPSKKLALNLRRGSFKKRASYGLHHLIWFETWRLPDLSWHIATSLNLAFALLPPKLRRLSNLVLDSETSVLLDASGFAYSDQIGTVIPHLMARRSEKAKREGKKIILLPQAFGPFHKRETRDQMTRILAHADLVFPRDRLSNAYLEDLGVRSSHIHIAPDFTNLLEGRKPRTFSGKGRIAIIPNTRMLEMTSKSIQNAYMPFLLSCLDFYAQEGLDPFILLHEFGKDVEFAKQIQQQMDNPVEVVRADDPLEIKGIIGDCDGVVSSRYHGLVNALSQGVPTLAVGWSHKYTEIMMDYNVSQCLLSDIDDEETNIAAFRMLSTSYLRLELQEIILEAAALQKEMTRNMWDRIHEVIGS